MDAAIDAIAKVAPSIKAAKMNTGADFVSGGSALDKTNGNAAGARYGVQSSLGSWTAGAGVTARGYMVYSSVQANLVSEEQGH